MLRSIIDRWQTPTVQPDIEVTPDHIKEGIAAEQQELRRELARLQLRAMRLATEYRSREVDDA